MSRTILIIDDDIHIRRILAQIGREAGYEVETAPDGPTGLRLLAYRPISLVLLDMKLPGMDGLAILREIRRRAPGVPVLILTAFPKVATAVEAMRLGATDYLRKPFNPAEVQAKLVRALAQIEAAQTPSPSKAASPLDDLLVGQSEAMADVRRRAAIAAGRWDGVLIWGERGTGKTTLAHLIHAAGPRPDAPLVIVPCDVLSSAALAAELTAEGDALDRALGGTLLLDAIESLTVEQQQAAVQALTPLVREAVGPARPRLLATFGGDPAQALADGRLAPALYHLFAVVAIRLPPLRERPDDLPLLLRHFLGEREVTPPAWAALRAGEWPGNIAQLERVLARAAQLAGNGPIELRHLPDEIAVGGRATPFHLPPEGIELESVERSLLEQALDRTAGNKSRAARLVGLGRHAFLYRLKKHGLVERE